MSVGRGPSLFSTLTPVSGLGTGAGERQRPGRTRRPSRARAVGVAVLAVVLLGSGCGNSWSKTTAAGANGTGGATASGGSDSGTSSSSGVNVKVDAPGVTSTEIRVGGVASVTNPLGGHYEDSFTGVQAYFDMVNAHGGLYGRKLVLGAKRDDKLGSNKSEIEGLLTEDNVFAVLPVASLLFTGADTLVARNVPTFGWTINPEWEGSAKDPRANLFGQSGSYLCFKCDATTLPWLAQQIGAHHVAVLAYSVAQSSDCADGVRASFAKYGKRVHADIAYADQSLAFGVADLSVQVSKMKNAKVDLVTTCMDNNGVVTLAKEMKKQKLKAPQSLPNAYDHQFLDEFGDLFEGSYVRTDFVQFEVKDKPKGLQTFLDAMRKAGKQPSENSLVGWLNADLFVTGLRAAGPHFDRQKLIDAVNHLTHYRAGGIVHGVDWRIAHTQRDSTTENCQFLSRIHNSKFDPVFSKPGRPFVCTVAQPSSMGARYDP